MSRVSRKCNLAFVLNREILFVRIDIARNLARLSKDTFVGRPRPPRFLSCESDDGGSKVCLLRATAWKRGRETRARSDDTLLYTWRAPAPSFPVPFSVSRVFVPRNTTRRRIHGEKWSLDELPATPNVDELHCLGGVSDDLNRFLVLEDCLPEIQMFRNKNLH